jgi:hypothetical protein
VAIDVEFIRGVVKAAEAVDGGAAIGQPTKPQARCDPRGPGKHDHPRRCEPPSALRVPHPRRGLADFLLRFRLCVAFSCLASFSRPAR